MNAQISPIARPALDTNAQHGLSQLEVHLAVHDHSSWHQGVNHRWFGLAGVGHFFPQQRHRLWKWFGLFYSLVLPLICGGMAIQSLSISDRTVQRMLWLTIALLGLTSLWVIRKTWLSWRYHREQDARPTHGLYVVPGALLIRCPANSRPGAQLPLEWQVIPLKSIQGLQFASQNMGRWQKRRSLWYAEIELTVPADTGQRFIQLWNYPDFHENGPVQTALKDWFDHAGKV